MRSILEMAHTQLPRVRRQHARQARMRPGAQLRPLALSALLLLAGTAAQAMSFAEVVAAARANDAQYRASQHELEAVRLGVPIARASLLPAVGINVSQSEVSGSRQFFNALNQEAKVQLAYSAPTSSLALRMPLYNREARARYDQSQVQVEAAEQVFRSRGLDLVERAGTAYLQVLLSDDGVDLAVAQLANVEGQLQRAEQRFKRGEGTRTEQATAQAAVDLAKVKVLEARDQADLSRRNLRRVTGRETSRLNQLAADFIPGPTDAGTLFDWLERGERNSPMLQARQQNLMAARLGVERQQAGHYPRVDLVANIVRNENDSVNNLGQTSVLKTLGVQLNVPIYNGGGVDAGVRQALQDQSRAEQDIRNERENMQVEVQRNHQSVANGAGRIEAYRRAVLSSEVAFKGAVRAQELGMGTVTEALDAQTRLYAAQRDLAQARYDYLLARMRLLVVAGAGMEEVVSDIDRLLPVQQPQTR